MTPNTNADKKRSYASFYNRQDSLKQEILNNDSVQNNNTSEANVKETETSYHYELKIPGYIKEDFNFYIADDKLVVTTERRRYNKKIEANSPTRHSYCYPSALFKRRFPLPEDIVRNKITVEYCDEVLSFRLFKQ